jgi:hypothetical protein
MDIFSAIFHGFNISRTPPVDTYLHIKKIYKGWCFVQTWAFLTRLTFAHCGCTCSCNLWLQIISEWCSSLDTELRYNHRAKILLAFFRHLEAGNNRKPYTLNLVTTLRGFFTSPVLYLRLPQKNLATKRNKQIKTLSHVKKKSKRKSSGKSLKLSPSRKHQTENTQTSKSPSGKHQTQTSRRRHSQNYRTNSFVISWISNKHPKIKEKEQNQSVPGEKSTQRQKRRKQQSDYPHQCSAFGPTIWHLSSQ